MGRKHAPTREVELKLEFGPGGPAGWSPGEAGLADATGGDTRSLLSTYFDTADRALRRDGVAVRVRQDGERRILTVKQEDGGPYDRRECEAEIEGSVPEADAVPDKGLRKLVARAGDLAPIFESRIQRTAWLWRRDDSAIELCFDQGLVLTGERTSPVAELELELKHGSLPDLFGLARILVAATDLRLGVMTKAERGYRLADEAPAGAAKAEPVALRPGLAAGDSFQVIARACIRHFRLNEPRLLAERAEDGLHQARVALRRLRAALTLFGALFDPAEIGPIKSELRTVSRLLGEARNRDVYLRRLAEHEAENPLEPGLAELKDRIRAERGEAYDRVLAELGTPAFRVAMIDLVAFVETGAWTTSDDLAEARDEAVEDFAARTLRKRRRRLRRLGEDLASQPPEALHRLRIATKKLRYATEFFAELVGGKKGRKRRDALIGALSDLQDALGDLNDVATGHDMATDLARNAQHGSGPDPAIHFATGRFSAAADAETGDLLAAAADAYARIDAAKLPLR